MVEQDLELLESYLDDALSDDETQALRRRLSQEPGLVEALASLQSQRRARQAVWAAMEPDEASVSRLVERVGRSVDHRLNFARRFHAATRGLAAAAIFVFGVGIGMYSMHARNGVDPGINTGGFGPFDGSQVVSQPAREFIVVDPLTGREQRFASQAEARRFAEQLRNRRADR